jgi:hypothetical protein
MHGTYGIEIKIYVERFIAKTEYSDINLSVIPIMFYRPLPTFHKGINSSGEACWLLYQPSLHPHPNSSYVYVERLLGAKRSDNPWVPNVVNVALGVTPAV